MEGVRERGTGNGGAGAIQGDLSGASVQWGGASGTLEAGEWRQGPEEQNEGPGRKPAAAAGRMAGSLGVSEGEEWLELS